MLNTFEALQADGNYVILNLLLQLTLFTACGIILAKRFRHNAAARYAILFPAMISMTLLVGTSLFLQSNDKILFHLTVPQSTEQGLPAFIMPFADLSFSNIIEADIRLNTTPQGLLVDGANPTALVARTSDANPWGLFLSLPLYTLALIIWLGGFLFMTIGLLRSFHHIDRISRKSRSLPKSQLQILQQLLEGHCRKNLELRIRISDHIDSPMLVGLVDPIILMPTGIINSLSDQQLKSVLLHELAHLKRKDALANFIQKVLLAIFWFHPLVHMMDRLISRAREDICDNYVLEREHALSYSEVLLQVSRLSTAQKSRSIRQRLAMGVLGSQWNLEQRIRELLSNRRIKIVELTTRTNRFVQLMVIGFSLLLAACQLGAADNQVAQNQNSVLAEQASEYQRLQAETELLRGQLQSLREQLDRREQNLSSQSLSRANLMRSIAEIRSILASREELRRFEDIAQLTKQIFEETLTQSRSSTPVILNERATEYIEDMVSDLDNNRHDSESLLRSISRLSPILARQDAATSTSSNSETTRRPPPLARSAGMLSNLVYEAISEIQQLMSPNEEEMEPDLDAAKEKLDTLFESNYEEMNDFEKSTTLSFYTNYYLSIGDYLEAISTFEQFDLIENLRPDTRLRALRSLGQLHAAIENWQESIDSYNLWRESSAEEDELIYRGLSYAYYQLDQFEEALPYWVSYMDFQRTDGKELKRDDYSYLNGLYFILDDYDHALENTNEMILLFNHPTDWNNLRAIYSSLNQEQPRNTMPADINGVTSSFFSTDVSIKPGAISATDGDYLPLIAVSPQYPSQAAEQKLEGWALVSFTVDALGNVESESTGILDSEPPDVFDRASIRAANRFKFQPHIEDGAAVEVPGVQYLFTYRLEDNV